MTAEINEFDVVIAGGGTTGICLALSLLKQTSLRIAIVESHDQLGTQPHPGFDSRSVALAAKSVELLEKLGIESIAEIGCPIEHIQVSDRGHLGQCLMHAQDYQLDALGRVAELTILGNALFELVDRIEPERLRWYRPDSIDSVKRSIDKVEIITRNGACLAAKLLVIAEGGNSPTRTKMDLPVSQHHYEQIALIANVEVDKPHQNWAFERFTPSGPLAMLPLLNIQTEQNRSRCSLVWTLQYSQKEEVMSMSDTAFLEALQREFGYRLGKLLRVGKRESYPLVLTHAEQLISHRTVVIGNAAQTLHPIAGQGLNLALRDIDTLSRVITNASDASIDIGSYAMLHQYAEARQPDRQSVIRLTDSLVRVFSNDYFPFVVGRNIGLGLLNLLSAGKSQLANQAMGRSAKSHMSMNVPTKESADK